MYKLRMNKKDYLRKKEDFISYNVKVKKEEVEYISKKLPEDYEYEIIRNYKVDLFKIIKRKVGLILGLVIFAVTLVLNSIRVKEIIFTNEKDQEVVDYLNTKINNGFLKEDILDINHEMKKLFPVYEWISVTKVGNTLIVDSKDAPHYQKVEFNNKEGNFYAANYGLVKYFQIDKGLPLIEYNQYVEKGQLLVSGNLNHLSPGLEENQVPPRGIIIAETFTIETHSIEKKISREYLTGRVETDRYSIIFNNKYNQKNTKYKLYNKKVDVVFNLFNLFSIESVKYYEKNVIMNTYDMKSAQERAESDIYYNFFLDLKHEKEDIKEIILLSSNELDSEFHFKFLIKKWENITEFVAR